MSISQVLVILLRRGWIVVLTLLTATIVAGGVLLFVPGRYDAVATASIDPGNVDPISQTVVRRRDDRADARQHHGACHQPAGGGRRRQAIEPDRQSAGPGEFPAVGVLRSREHRRVDGFLLVKNVDPKFNMGTDVLAIKYKSSDPNQAALDRKRVSRVDDRRLGGDEDRLRRPDCALVCAANRGIAQGRGDGARGA